MARLSILILLFFSLTSMGMAGMRKVLVVGAGPAGIAAAQRLKANNFDVTIIEKEERIGGKCFSVPCHKGYGIVELGAIQVGIGYPVVNAYRKAIGMRLRDTWSSRSLRFHDDDPRPIYTDLSEEYWPIRDSLSIMKEAATMNDALIRFSQYDNRHFVSLNQESEFAKPFEQWADELGLDHFKEDFRVWITSYGYGQLDHVPAYLPLTLINSSVGLVFLRRFNMNMRMLEGGYGGLMQGIVDHYDLKVRLGTTIQYIDRLHESDKVKVTYIDKDGVTNELFDRLVVACGIGCMKDLFTPEQLTQEEKDLIDNIHVSPYDVVIANIPGLEKGGYVLPQFLKTPGHVSLISKNSAQGDDVILYVPRAGSADTNGRIKRPSEADLTSAIKNDMAKFGFDNIDILHIQYWDNYFEHWQQPRFYRILDMIQELNKTTYVGAMARYEIVERAMEHAHDVVDRHILHHAPKKKGLISGVLDSVRSFYDYATADYKDN